MWCAVSSAVSIQIHHYVYVLPLSKVHRNAHSISYTYVVTVFGIWEIAAKLHLLKCCIVFINQHFLILRTYPNREVQPQSVRPHIFSLNGRFTQFLEMNRFRRMLIRSRHTGRVLCSSAPSRLCLDYVPHYRTSGIDSQSHFP